MKRDTPLSCPAFSGQLSATAKPSTIHAPLAPEAMTNRFDTFRYVGEGDARTRLTAAGQFSLPLHSVSSEATWAVCRKPITLQSKYFKHQPNLNYRALWKNNYEHKQPDNG